MLGNSKLQLFKPEGQRVHTGFDSHICSEDTYYQSRQNNAVLFHAVQAHCSALTFTLFAIDA